MTVTLWQLCKFLFNLMMLCAMPARVSSVKLKDSLDEKIILRHENDLTVSMGISLKIN